MTNGEPIPVGTVFVEGTQEVRVDATEVYVSAGGRDVVYYVTVTDVGKPPRQCVRFNLHPDYVNERLKR